MCTSFPKEAHETISRLSHLSGQVIAEIGESLWHDAALDFEDERLFFVFFRDRPDIARPIQSVTLRIFHARYIDDTTSTILLNRISEFISRPMDLQFLSVYVDFYWDVDLDPPLTEEME